MVVIRRRDSGRDDPSCGRRRLRTRRNPSSVAAYQETKISSPPTSAYATRRERWWITTIRGGTTVFTIKLPVESCREARIDLRVATVALANLNAAAWLGACVAIAMTCVGLAAVSSLVPSNTTYGSVAAVKAAPLWSPAVTERPEDQATTEAGPRARPAGHAPRGPAEPCPDRMPGGRRRAWLGSAAW